MIQITRIDGTEIPGAEGETTRLAAEAAKTYLQGAYLQEANLRGADLLEADLREADLREADLREADLRKANLRGANLQGAYLQGANLWKANLRKANLRGADLREADLRGATGLVKILGVEPGNFYWKRFDWNLTNAGFQFFVGLNSLRHGEIFAADERVTCSYPAFHFASRSWCAVYYPDRPYEAKIRIPLDAQVNEPWATDGKASADKIEILQVFEVATGKDVTDHFRRPEATNDPT